MNTPIEKWVKDTKSIENNINDIHYKTLKQNINI